MIYTFIHIHHISIDICIHNNLLHHRSQAKIYSALNKQCLNPDANNRELCKYVWNFEKSEITLIIDWIISCKVYGSPKRNICPLWLKEKLLIIDYPLLNKRSEFINKCRYENKKLIVNVK